MATPLGLALLQKAQAEAEGFANGPFPALNSANIYTQDSIGNPQTPGSSPVPYYPSSETPNLQLSTEDMPSQLANNFVILDNGVLKVNGTVVPTPANFINTPSVTFTADAHGNVSAISVSSSVWANLTGNLTETQVVPWDGPTVGTKDTGISRIGVASLAIGNGIAGDFSGNLKLTGINNVGTYTDSTGAVGTLGQVLESTVTGTKWIASAAGAAIQTFRYGPVTSLTGSTQGPYTVNFPTPYADGLYTVEVTPVGSEALGTLGATTVLVTYVYPQTTPGNGIFVYVTNNDSITHYVNFNVFVRHD